VLTIVLVFYKTVFLGLPISKIARLAEWDSIFSAYCTGAGGLCDPSLVQLLVPYHFLVAKYWQAGQLPLWNPYCGFGTPLVADVQASVFAPLRLLFYLIPAMGTYNLMLVLEVVLAALGTFAFVRSLGQPRYAAILAALAYALCPYNLYYLELLTGPAYCLFPGLFWLFVRAAQHPTAGRCAVAGAACAAVILSGHPEISFFAISFACLLMVVLMLVGPDRRASVGERMRLAVTNLLVAGSVAFCLSAPVLLPFLEYLANSDSYKFGVSGSTWVPWQALTYNLLQPGFGPASPYLGIVTALVLPLSFLAAARGQRNLLGLSLVALVAFIVSARLAPLNSLLQIKPFCWVITAYCLPFFLLIVAALAAGGVAELVERTSPGLNARFLALLSGAVALLVIPPLLNSLPVNLARGDFDMMLPHMAVSLRIWKVQIALLGIVAAAFLISGLRPGGRDLRLVLAVVVLLIGFVSSVTVAKSALPIQNRFSYPVVEPIPFLQKARARIVALGDHLLRPNTASVYGIDDIRVHNPMFPRRYRDFIRLCGAKLDMFNQVFSSASSPLLDLAAVRYVLSLDPLATGAGAKQSDGLRLVTSTPQRVYLYERQSALPEAYLVHRTVAAASDREALRLVAAPTFDPRVEAVVEEKEPTDYLSGFPGLVPAFNDSVSVERPGPNSVRVQTSSPLAGLLILTDTYYPGWQARLDGRAVPIIRANHLFRGVEIPAGRHRLEFDYRPLSFWAGAFLFLTCLLVMILLAVARRRGNASLNASLLRAHGDSRSPCASVDGR
jgi:hypothetical protein